MCRSCTVELPARAWPDQVERFIADLCEEAERMAAEAAEAAEPAISHEGGTDRGEPGP